MDISLKVTGLVKSGADGMVSFCFSHLYFHFSKLLDGVGISDSCVCVCVCVCVCACARMQAIWVTAQPGSEGQVYGNLGTWAGIGLFLDSFDNDGMVSACTNQYTQFLMCWPVCIVVSLRLGNQ